MEAGTHVGARQQGLQHRWIAAVGQPHRDAAGGGDAGGGEFGGHATGAPVAPPLGHARQGFQLRQAVHLGNGTGLGIAAGIPRIKAVDVGEQHQLIGPNGHGHQGGEGVVVAEAQLIGGQGVVLVDHGRDAPGEQLLEGAAGVLVAAP